MGILSKASKSKTEEYYPAFTNFTIKVDVESSWTKTVKDLLKSVQGVTNFKMEDDGKINISGYIDPNLLLKCLEKSGKKAQIVHWQYGECSSNLFVKKETPSTNNSNPGYGGYNGYDYRSYRRNNHQECAGSASDCSAHHIQKPVTTNKSSSSSSSKFEKLASHGPKSCSLM